MPATAVLLDALVSAAIPDPSVPVVPLPLPQVVGIFERLTGKPAWRHFELFAGPTPAYEGRADVELVVRTIAQLGNYDYMVDWVFNQSGAIRIDVALTGIDAPKGGAQHDAREPEGAQDTRFGALVGPNLVAPNHSHFFNFRLDLDVDGRDNSFMLGKLKTKDGVPGPRKSVWVVDEKRIDRERDGGLDADEVAVEGDQPQPHQCARLQHGLPAGVAQPRRSADEEGRLPARGIHRVSAVDDAATTPTSASPPATRRTRIRDSRGLPAYQQNDQSLVNTDLVLWLTIGHHHVTATEDFPVLSLSRFRSG